MTATALPRSRAALYLDLIRWNRPAGWLLLLWPTLSALWIAADGFPGWHLLAVFVLGTILMRSAGCCVNDVADRDFDRHVKRTAQRPVTRRAAVQQALAVGAVLAAAGLRAGADDQPAGHRAVGRGAGHDPAVPLRQARAGGAAGGAGRGLQLRHPDGLCRGAGRHRLGRWPPSSPRCRRTPGAAAGQPVLGAGLRHRIRDGRPRRRPEASA
jgi:hypothetical protein